MKLYQEHRVNPFASCLPLLLQLPVFSRCTATIKGLGPLDAPDIKPPSMPSTEASFLWIPHLGLPDPYYILLVLYVVTQLISTELMLVTQTDKTQKMLMRAMPIIFVFFLFNFPAGLFVYWVTTNLWTIGQQLLIRKVDEAVHAREGRRDDAKPAKRSRIVDALVSAQKPGEQPGPNGAAAKTPPAAASRHRAGRSRSVPARSRARRRPPSPAPRSRVAGAPAAQSQAPRRPPNPAGRSRQVRKQTPRRSGRKPLPPKNKSTPATAPVEAAEPTRARTARRPADAVPGRRHPSRSGA